MRFWTATIVLAACGRVAFDPVTGDGALVDDTGEVAFSCPRGPVPAQLTISGTSFRYTTFTNQTTPVAGVGVETYSMGVRVGMATTDLNGSYTMTVTNGGLAIPAYLTFNKATYLLTRVFFDGLLDRDLMTGANGLRGTGDGPIWNESQMDTIYSAAMVVRGTGAGAINVGVRDCDNNPIAGVQVIFDPPPGEVRYLDDVGVPTTLLATTGVVYGEALALNPATESTHVTAMKDGYRFSEATFTVSPTVNNLVLLHGGP